MSYRLGSSKCFRTLLLTLLLLVAAGCSSSSGGGGDPSDSDANSGELSDGNDNPNNASAGDESQGNNASGGNSGGSVGEEPGDTPTSGEPGATLTPPGDGSNSSGNGGETNDSQSPPNDVGTPDGDGNSGETPNDNSGNTSKDLKLTFLDSYHHESVSGIVVAIYEEDNRTIRQTLVSDGNGVVDFGDVGQDSISFTYLNQYSKGITGGEMRLIISSIDTPVDEYTIMVISDETVALCVEPSVTVNFSVPAIGATSTAFIRPGYSNFVMGMTGAKAQGKVCDNYAQDDGLVSYLVAEEALLNPGSPLSYGMLLDQPFPDAGDEIVIDLNQSATTALNWNVQQNLQPLSLSVEGDRKGIAFPLFQAYNLGSNQGVANVISAFPASRYRVSAAFDLNGVKQTFIRTYDSLPTSVDMDVSDYQFGYTDFDGEVYQWEITGETPRDALSIGFSENTFAEGEFISSDTTAWGILVPPNSTRWEVMELPKPANEWMDVSTIKSSENFVASDITIFNYHHLNGYDEYWESIRAGKWLMGRGIVSGDRAWSNDLGWYQVFSFNEPTPNF